MFCYHSDWLWVPQYSLLILLYICLSLSRKPKLPGSEQTFSLHSGDLSTQLAQLTLHRAREQLQLSIERE